MPVWSVTEPEKLTFDTPVASLHVRTANGTVNVVGTDDGSPRLQVSEIEGAPLIVTQQGGALTVAYEDLPWKGLLKWLDHKTWRRSAVVSLAVPTGTRVEVGVVGAGAVISGIEGRTEVKSVSGDTTLVGLSGPVRTSTVSGNVEAQDVTGDLLFNSVSGDLTVVDGAGASVRAESVSGSVIVDLASASVSPDGRATHVSVSNVSGEIAIRLPHPADARVEANTASGTVSNAFEDLRVSGQWGSKKITGRLGAGNGTLKASTVSGSIALLRRPHTEDPPLTPPPFEGPAPAPQAPAAGPRRPGPEDSGPGGSDSRDNGSRSSTPQDSSPGGTSLRKAPPDDIPPEAVPPTPDGPPEGTRAAEAPDAGRPAAAEAADAPGDAPTDKKVL
ncbi:DUF4097 family beta strand repeat-containing protein [Streptomyces sp. TS71-3]|uniref:DUF4097 family beta strand repeat-containing protein n=1 Tax=Streptomyces sp. TS71-3 TaxID=2733862 RepID=UPI001B092DB6|nr:DUF4097 family beta strand repeat-containing protein [Streptomyces sp. TS71-3]GHJ35914.1 hypothetical protein Sm713_15230 [Streptomyces sp. TS71-3]